MDGKEEGREEKNRAHTNTHNRTVHIPHTARNSLVVYITEQSSAHDGRKRQTTNDMCAKISNDLSCAEMGERRKRMAHLFSKIDSIWL